MEQNIRFGDLPGPFSGQSTALQKMRSHPQLLQSSNSMCA
jgi:hypothetical protein